MKLPSMRFTLRLLMVIVLAFGVWLGWVVRCARFQREAMIAVQRSIARTGYGVLIYDWQYQGGVVKGSGKFQWPAWLVDRLGIEYFQRITWASLCNPSEEELLPLARLGGLERLDLFGDEVDDAKLALVTSAGVSKMVLIKSSSITNSGLVHLGKMTGLEVVQLERNRLLTDAGVDELRRSLPGVEIRY
jgi:hypothetical protein